MSVNMTLNFIRENWSSATRAMDRRAFCLAVLPDAYDDALCRGQGGHFFDPDAPGGLSPQTINGLMRGNRKSAANLACASAAFTKDFLGKLHGGAPVTYRDPRREPQSCVENMLAKIRRLVRVHGTPRNRNHPLFVHMDLGTLGCCDETTENAYRRLRLAIHSLLERETESSLSYAIFLMVVAAILQDRILAVDHLYNAAAVERVLGDDADAPLLDAGNRRHIPFTDRDYMGDYNVYLYRGTSITIFKTGKLSFRVDDGGRPAAVLTIWSEGQRRHSFTGKPMLSQADQSVYIPMTDDQDAMIFLTFAYTPFNATPMYFRPALLISTQFEPKLPQVQRIALVARDLSAEELPYVKGLLKTMDKQILISEKQLDIFLETFRDYPWMADFRENYLPVFEIHRRSFYCFYEDELLSCSASDLPYQDRLRIMLALRSVDPPNDSSLHKFLRAAAPSRTHTILR